jgi:RNA polymerase sigma-70 factor (ECF subfamily)
MASQEQEGTRTDASLQTRWSLIGRLKDMDDQQSWQEFFDGYWKLIYSVALKAGLSDAEAQDVVQETVIFVAKKMPEFKADPVAGSFKSWLLTLTRWRIIDQARKRQAKPGLNPDGGQEFPPNAQTGIPALQHGDDSARTSTVDRIPDPALDLEAVWNEEWENNLLVAAAERVKRQVDPEQFQLFDFHVLKQWPAKKVARKLGVNLSQVYFAKYKISKLMKKEIKKLEAQMT